MFWSTPFDPKKDIPSLESKVILITGGNAGLGREQIRFLAAHKPTKLYLAARTQAKADEAIADIARTVPGATIHFLELDLSSLAAVKKAADAFRKENDRLDLLVNNAGIMAHPASLSVDGYEAQFATNHMGHFLLTRELLPLLEATAARGADVRVINLSSMGHRFAPPGGFLPELVTTDMADHNTWRRYGQSKLANILFTLELARRHPTVTSVSIHPGAVNTNLADQFRQNHPWLNVVASPLFNLFMNSSAKGALNQTWASVAPLEAPDAPAARTPRVRQGEYYQPVAAIGQRTAESRDLELAKKLWDWSEAEVVKKGY